MMNQEWLENYYKNAGYTCLGWVNISKDAQKAYQKSEKKQWHEIGRNLHLIACHDLKVFIMIDSSD